MRIPPALARSIDSTRARGARVGLRARALRARVLGGEADRATDYWRNLPGYHLAEDGGPDLERSRWIADALVPELGIESLLEVGTNTGRNLAVVKSAHPEVRASGIDVNEAALDQARGRGLDIDFRLADANSWSEPPKSWDAILTMSVLDHIPDDAVEKLASNIAASARHVIAVELWTGKHAETDLYKYSRDTRELFERHGARTVRWEHSPGQYDPENSPLWAYVGAFD